MRNLLEKRGAECMDLPLIQIKPAEDQSKLQSELTTAKKARAWIFTSVNAVHQAHILDQGGWPPCFAIGPATARALIESGQSEVFTAASGSSSEALLAHPDLQDVEDQELLICTGRGGLTQIEETLRKRGARVRRIELYYRERLTHPDETVRQAIQAAQGIILTSGEALTQLFERAAEADRKKLLAAFLVVPSPRVIELAQSLGFANVSAPAHTSDETLIDCLAQAFTQAARDPLEKTMTDDAKAPHSPVDSSSESPVEKVEPSSPLSAADRKEQKERLRAEPNNRDKSSGSKAGAFVAVAMGVIILGLMAVVGYAGWLLMQERSQMSERLAAQNEKVLQMGQRVDNSVAATADIKQDLGRLERKLEAASGDLQALQKKVEDGLAQMGRVAAEISGGRARFELASVEHLLALANDRIQIAGDVKGALTALQGADDRLERLADPQMFPVRAKLAEELTALKAVKVAEISTASLSLASLIQQVPDLPLAIQAPREFEKSEARSETRIELDAGWKRFLESIKEAGSSLFNVRRDDDDAKILRLLSPEAETAVYDILTLKLEGARVSMLKGNTAAMHAQLLSASSWLRQQFRSNDTAVVAMSAELEQLGTMELSPALPDISGSLVTLRRKLKDSE